MSFTADKDKRDIMIYLLWETGKYTNMRIGNLFGLTYSSISRRVNITKSGIAGGDQIRGRYQLLKSQIKV
jgi:putative transposase